MIDSPLSIRRFSDLETGAHSDLAYERKSPTSSIFLGPDHNAGEGKVDELSLTCKTSKSADPDFPGNNRVYLKLKRTASSVNSITGKYHDLHAEVTFTQPVGTSAADLLEMELRVIGIVSATTVMSDMAIRGES